MRMLTPNLTTREAAAAAAALEENQLRNAAKKTGYGLSEAPDGQELARWQNFVNDGVTDEERAVLGRQDTVYPYSVLELDLLNDGVTDEERANLGRQGAVYPYPDLELDVLEAFRTKVAAERSWNDWAE